MALGLNTAPHLFFLEVRQQKAPKLVISMDSLMTRSHLEVAWQELSISISITMILQGVLSSVLTTGGKSQIHSLINFGAFGVWCLDYC